MNNAGAKHHHNVLHHQSMVFECLLFVHGHIAKARCYITIAVCDQFHKQDPVKTAVRLRNSNAGIREKVEGVDFCILPSILLLFAAIARAFVHSASAPAIAYFATLLIEHCLFEAALSRLFIHFGAPNLCAAANSIDGSFFTTHQLTYDLVNYAIVN